MLNKHRVFPRLFSILFGNLLFKSCDWFMQLETPSAEQSAFVIAMVTAGSAWFKFYVDSGNKNSIQKPNDSNGDHH
ncbi:hypothetical protein [Marinicellulosiphila megalodicopiae]|uniref:hypothetical protein n=1 Tax=Marinicellulosiphila megalodicopiae TaxID=2724896 RepID=UPI003BB0A14A